jgi:hypothetical protein
MAKKKGSKKKVKVKDCPPRMPLRAISAPV